MTVEIKQGDCREVLRSMPDESVHCVVTSPPYFGLRDYGVSGQMGLEGTPAAFVEGMVAVFREVRRALRADGTLWLNIGDSYFSPRWPGSVGDNSTINGTRTQAAYHAAQHTKRGGASGNKGHEHHDTAAPNRSKALVGFKPKDLLGIPWMLAFALRADGWYLRQDIIWSKPNPMPESVTDRCTKAHEYLFLLSKSERYYYDAEAIAEPVTLTTVERMSRPTLDDQAGSDRVPGKTNGPMKAVLKSSGNKARKCATERGCPNEGVAGSVPWEGSTRNKRSVWTVTTQPFSEAHFATFPPALIEPCILAACPEGGTVLDPFGGAGTTGLVADRHHRNAILIELNPEYAAMAKRRIEGESPLFAQVVA